MIGDQAEETIYFNVPASEIEEVQQYIAETDEKISETAGYVLKDSLGKNERKLIEDALKRTDARRAKSNAPEH